MVQDTPSRKLDQYIVRFPEGMRDRIKAAADTLGRSMNAEIVQRLSRSLEDDDDTRLKLDLPSDVSNALMLDAALHHMDMEERAVQVLTGAFGEAEGYATALDRLGKAISENADLRDRMAATQEKLDINFILYYSKVIQFRQFVGEIIDAEKGTVPARLQHLAAELDLLTQAEQTTLRDQYEDAVFRKKLRDNALRNAREMEDAERPEDLDASKED